jgi:hydroxyacylglutathione hydrolase
VNLYVLPAGPIQTNAYLLTDSAAGTAVLIDAPGDVWEQVRPILESEGCRLEELWITHGHWDHTQGAAGIVRETKAVVRAHEADRAMIENPEIMERFMGEALGLEPVRVDQWLSPGAMPGRFSSAVEVRHVPGHCPGNVLFYFPALSVGDAPPAPAAFVGDAIFRESVGRADLPGGDFATLENSIRQQIYSLPERTLIYPGHGPTTTVGHEKKYNPYVHG